MGVTANPRILPQCYPFATAVRNPVSSLEMHQYLLEVGEAAALQERESAKAFRSLNDRAIAFSKRMEKCSPGTLFVAVMTERDAARGRDATVVFARCVHVVDDHRCLITICPFETGDSVFVFPVANLHIVPPELIRPALYSRDEGVYDVTLDPFTNLKEKLDHIALEFLIQYMVDKGGLDERVVRTAFQIYQFSRHSSSQRRTHVSTFFDDDDDDGQEFPELEIPIFSLGALIGQTWGKVSHVKRECRSSNYADLDPLATKCRVHLLAWLNDPQEDSPSIVTPSLVKRVIEHYINMDAPSMEGVTTRSITLDPPMCWREEIFCVVDGMFRGAIQFVSDNLDYILNGKKKRRFNDWLLSHAQKLGSMISYSLSLSLSHTHRGIQVHLHIIPFHLSPLTPLILHLLSPLHLSGDEYLAQHGFVVDAIPNDYLDRRPPNMDVIRRNLEILDDLININSPNSAKTMQFIVSVTNEMSQKVRDFETSLLDLLAAVTNIPLLELKDPAVLAESLKNLKSPYFRNRNFTWMSHESRNELIEDLQYLMEMRQMDHDWLERAKSPLKGAKNKLTDVVPVSGRLFAIFRAHEQDHRTAIERWDSESLSDFE